jgi:hypothetical protein
MAARAPLLLLLLFSISILLLLRIGSNQPPHSHSPDQPHYDYDFQTQNPSHKPKPRTPVPSLFTARYSEQTFIGAHDSVALRTEENGWSISGNQYLNISTQLDYGVRLLQAQGHPNPEGVEGIRLCHFNCALMNGGSLHEFLTTVKGFLDANPKGVVTLLFVNVGVPLEWWASAYYETGMDVSSYIPPYDKRKGAMMLEDWPTIEEMVSSNRRLITFLSNGADEEQVPYLLNQFDYMFETNFVIDSPNQFSCTPARPRPSEPWAIPKKLSLVNHFLYAKFLGFRYPNASYANVTNGAGFRTGELGEHAARCRNTYERRPNYLLVDFFNEGEVFEVEYGMNAY